tara:strand:- start:121 stop:453 length:333 start_codon:yes stop_codon:yes gene_type:complete
MFGFIRRLARPFGMIGEKLSQIFRLGKKTNKPMGVVREVVIESGKPIGGFLKMSNKEGRIADTMNSAGAFVGGNPVPSNIPRFKPRPLTDLDYEARTSNDIMRGFNQLQY